ncbi:hypothetical protein AcW1_003544 [Taiwanofungus camphoratus]|nr:hypothetical protein AcW1_003544 [Antrodia cinnamomea]
MRFRWCLDHPEFLSGKRDFVLALTQDPRYGIEFVEQWEVSWMIIAVVLLRIISLVTGILYSILAHDVSGGFVIAGYITSASSMCPVLVGVLNLTDVGMMKATRDQ